MNFFNESKFCLPAGTLIKFYSSRKEDAEYLLLLENVVFNKNERDETWVSEKNVYGQSFLFKTSKGHVMINFRKLVLLKADSIFLPG